MSGIFITGTDTGIGKTWCTAALLRALNASGQRALGMKPVASGCESTAQGLRNEDALALQAAGAFTADYADINPFALREPTAPEIAARLDGVDISLAPIQAAYQRLAVQADIVLVEGVGGWLAPVTERMDQADIARALSLDVVLVVGLRLGCLNHARLSVEAIRARGFRLRGWIANEVDPEMGWREEYFSALCRVMDAPLIGRVGFRQTQAVFDLSALRD